MTSNDEFAGPIETNYTDLEASFRRVVRERDAARTALIASTAEAEARGYQRAIDVLWGIATRNGNPSAEASYFARRLVSEASAHTAIRSGESTDDDR